MPTKSLAFQTYFRSGFQLQPFLQASFQITCIFMLARPSLSWVLPATASRAELCSGLDSNFNPFSRLVCSSLVCPRWRVQVLRGVSRLPRIGRNFCRSQVPLLTLFQTRFQITCTPVLAIPKFWGISRSPRVGTDVFHVLLPTYIFFAKSFPK